MRKVGLWLAIVAARYLASWSMRRYARTRDDWFRELAVLLFGLEARVRIFGEKVFPEWQVPAIPLRGQTKGRVIRPVRVGELITARDCAAVYEPVTTALPGPGERDA